MHMELSEREQERILPILAKAEIFSALPNDILKTLISRLKAVYLVGGEVLINQDEEADSLYVVVNGRLRATKKTETGEITVGEIGQGEAVGEIGLLLNTRRSATVRAVRDSLLLKFDKQTYDEFAELFPHAMLSIARSCIRRLVPDAAPKKAGNNICTLTIIPAGSNHHLARFVTPFIKSLSNQKRVLYLNRAIIYSTLGMDVKYLGVDDNNNTELINWLLQQENNYEYVIYEADYELTSWTERCLRQADRVIAVADHQDNAELNDLEQYIAQKELKVLVDLVLLQGTKPTDTARWLQARQLYNHHHILNDAFSDYQKFTRYITGTAVGLVLSGGGARGLAYAGLLKALQEFNIPIDYTCGTSMGAVMSGVIAQGIDYQELIKLIQTALAVYNRSFDYTLPITSILNGRGVNAALASVFPDELMIEDLACNFFCVSTNLSEGKLQIHDRGSILKAIRASVSLPVIFPPVLSNNQLLVDGALINNMPVDIMRERINGGKILAASLLLDKPAKTHYSMSSETLSGWRLLLQRVKSKEKFAPTIAEIISNSLKISSSHYQALMEKQATFCLRMDLNEYDLLDFNQYPKIAAKGYELARLLLEEYQKNL